MPELPEVQTTVNGLKKHIIGLTIREVWTNYNSPYFKGSETIKDPTYFKHFKKEVIGGKVISVERRAKNILINIENKENDTINTESVAGGKSKGGKKIGIAINGINEHDLIVSRKTILVHMKMTGHLLYGLYKFVPEVNKSDPWQPIEPEGLKDPFNKRVRFVITFDNGRYLALSDTRKFAKVAVVDTATIHQSTHLNDLGPEPLNNSFTYERFVERLNRKLNSKIKQVLTDQTILSGIGNIYADESLWRASIHPLKKVRDIKMKNLHDLFKAIKLTLSSGIDLGGDSMSDYRNILGLKGKFQEQHHAYHKTGEPCEKKGCNGKIVRIVVGGRATHYCERHQVLSE